MVKRWIVSKRRYRKLGKSRGLYRPKKSTSKLAKLRGMVKKQIARSVETKHAQSNNLQLNLVGPANVNFATTNIIPLTPSAVTNPIAQGSGEGQRVGNRIKIKKLTFKGIIHPLPQNSTTNNFPRPQVIKMFIFSSKDDPSAYPTISSTTGDFFQFNNGAANIYDDLLSDIAPVNKDKWTLHTTRTLKVAYADYGGTGSVAGNQFFANNDFKSCAKFSVDVTKYCVKNVIYRDNNSDPSTRYVFAMFVPMDCDGNTMGPNAIRSSMQYYVDLDYSDA